MPVRCVLRSSLPPVLLLTGIFLGCEMNPPAPVYTHSNHTIVATTAPAEWGQAGNVGVYAIDSVKSYGDLLPIAGDNDVRAYRGCVYLLERGSAGNIIKITGSSISPATIDTQYHVGDAVNIHDIAFISDTKAYVTLYDKDYLAVYNPSTGTGTGATIDLSAYSSPGTTGPGMDRALVDQGKVYVLLQRLNADWSQPEYSSVLVINGSDDQIVKEIRMTTTNPQGMCVQDGMLYVACTGAFAVADGGIMVIGLATLDTLGVMVTDEDLGGDAVDVLNIDEQQGYAIVSDAAYTNSLKSYNPSTGVVGETITAAGVAASMVFDGTYLYVANRSTTDQGIVVIDPRTNTKVGATHRVGSQPPARLAYLVTEEEF